MKPLSVSEVNEVRKRRGPRAPAPNYGGHNPAYIARVLVEAYYLGDQRAAKRNGITTRTIVNYRHRLDLDDNVSELFAQGVEAWSNRWASRLGSAIVEAINFIQRAAVEADPRDPESIAAVTEALKVCAEISVAKDIIDARIEQYRTALGANGGPLAGTDNAPDTPAFLLANGQPE